MCTKIEFTDKSVRHIKDTMALLFPRVFWSGFAAIEAIDFWKPIFQATIPGTSKIAEKITQGRIQLPISKAPRFVWISVPLGLAPVVWFICADGSTPTVRVVTQRASHTLAAYCRRMPLLIHPSKIGTGTTRWTSESPFTVDEMMKWCPSDSLISQTIVSTPTHPTPGKDQGKVKDIVRVRPVEPTPSQMSPTLTSPR